MDTLRWSRLQALFAQALALPRERRDAFIDALQGDDAGLAGELRALLARDDEATRGDPVAEGVQRAAASWAGSARHALVGTRLGAWRVVAHLADGGMGAVYRGERADGQYEQAVAIKLLNPAMLSADGRARMAAERQILARLSHPLIARLIDGGDSPDGVPYLVMELIDGEPIDAWCEQERLTLAARLRLVIQVCQAVHHAHRHLVVHRDLKPGNILVQRDGTPRLLDFGIARLLDAPGVTRAGERLLTPGYASPEQITGAPITTATDVYALGALLYTLLAGRLPHDEAARTSPAALARAIVEQEPPRPSHVAGLDRARAQALAGDLDTIVMSALRKEPGRRYTTALELAEDLERHLAQRPVRARPDTLAYRSAKFASRHPVALPASALALALAIGAAVLFTWRLADERDRALAAERSARRTAEFTASLLKGSGADQGAARQISVLEWLGKAARRIDTELADEPEVAGRLRSALGSALHSWGAYDEAKPLLDAALATLRARHAGPHADTAQVLSLLSSVTHDQGQLETSLDWTRQAEAMWRIVGTPAQQGAALADLALSLNALRRRSEAEPVFREALARQREAHRGDHADIAWTLNNLAWGLHAMGRLDEAVPLYDEALAMQRRLKVGGADLFQTLNNLAGAHWDRGDLDTAERQWREVLAMTQALYGQGRHAAVARAHNMVALVTLERGRLEEARVHSEQALQANLELLGETHRWTATTLQTHGVVLLALGRSDDAQAMLARAAAARRTVLPPGHADNIGSLNGLARVALRRGDLARAERELREALRIIEGITSPDRTQRDVVEWQLGRVLALQGRRDEGRTLAEAGLARRRAAMPQSHHRRLAAEAGIALPPFVEQADAAAQTRARQTLASLRERLGPQAPVVVELEEQLALLADR